MNTCTAGLVARLTEYARQSIRRHGTNEDYERQDLPFASYPSEPGVVYRAGTEVGGRRCPRCPDYISVTSRVVRLRRKESGRWWVHERCADPTLADIVLIS